MKPEIQEFKVNRQFTLSIILIGFTIFIGSWIFNAKFESEKLDIFHFLFYIVSAMVLSIGVYSHYFIRLFISKAGIRLEGRYFGWLNYAFSWQEIKPVMTFANPLNKQTQFFFYSPQLKLLKGINPILFEPIGGKQYSESFSFKEKVFGSKQATALERVIRQYAGETKAMKHTEIRSLVKNSSADLGKEAGFLAGVSIMMFAIGTVLLILGNSKHLILSPANYWIATVIIFSAMIAIKLIPNEKKLATFLITPLFAACCAWLFVQCMHFYVLRTTEAQVIEYRLSESQNVHQVWQAEGLPDIEVYSDPGNLVYEKIGNLRPILIHIGPMGFYDVTREEVNKLLKKSQKL